MSNLLYVAVGGALGAGLRYGVSLAAFKVAGASFPWGTLFVNVLGSLLVGFVWGYLDQTTGSQRTFAFFFMGMMGAFTTFSAYALESLRLYRDGQVSLAAANVLANNTGALLAVFAGFILAQWLFHQLK